MIYAEKKDLEDYMGISEYLDVAIDTVLTRELTRLAMGKNEIAGKEVFANRMEYDTVEEEEAFYEAHEIYIDVHLLLEGSEQICVNSTDNMKETERDRNTDFVGYEGEAACICQMTPEKVLIVFPGEAHKVKVKAKETSHVKKVVLKVKYENQTR